MMSSGPNHRQVCSIVNSPSSSADRLYVAEAYELRQAVCRPGFRGSGAAQPVLDKPHPDQVDAAVGGKLPEGVAGQDTIFVRPPVRPRWDDRFDVPRSVAMEGQ